MQEEHKHYKGYAIPHSLIGKTGGGPDTWEGIIQNHFRAYDRLTPIRSGQVVVEIGCGVGRDAIPISEIVGPAGKYVGIDVIRESIEWCRNNITARNPNFEFHHFDIWSQGYNPSGTLKTEDIFLPAGNGTADLILLQSVFTHMFKSGIAHYLQEFRRVLKPTGRVFATCFVADQVRLQKARTINSRLKFQHSCDENLLTNDARCPENAVALPRDVLEMLIASSRLELAMPIQLGYWAGDKAHHYQDIMILKKPS